MGFYNAANASVGTTLKFSNYLIGPKKMKE